MTNKTTLLDDKTSNASETRYRDLFNSTPIAFFSLSKHGIIREVNKAAEDLLSFDSRKLIKRNISSLFPKNGTSSDAGKLLVSEVLQGKEIKDLEVQMIDAEGKRIWVSVTASLLKTPGMKEGIGLIALNIDRRKTAEARAIAERERASLVLEIMTHDLNNVNQSLVFSLGLIDEMVDIPESGRNLVRQTIQEVRKSARMISNLRSIIDLTEKSLEHEYTDTKFHLDQAIQLVEEEVPSKRLVVNTNIKEGEYIIEGHPQIQTIFFNMLLNSLEFAQSEEVVVNVLAEKINAGDEIRISIEDSGPGVPDSLKEHIFRRSGEPDSQIVGRGLGLTLVDRIVASLGGSVWVEDKVENDHSLGARFVLVFRTWSDQRILECGRACCITFYKSNHCLFCGPTYEILTGVMDELGVPRSSLEVINVDDPGVEIDESELPMLPLTRICDTEITGFAEINEVRVALVNLMMKTSYPH